MTNGEKYKTAKERTDAFDKYCDKRCSSDQMCFVAGCRKCLLEWFDLDAEEEKPLPCPFCGGECVKETACGKGYRVVCEHESCGYVSSWKKTMDEAIAAHNCVAKKCMDEGLCDSEKCIDAVRQELDKASPGDSISYVKSAIKIIRKYCNEKKIKVK